MSETMQYDQSGDIPKEYDKSWLKQNKSNGSSVSEV